jgi:hypothetical protein
MGTATEPAALLASYLDLGAPLGELRGAYRNPLDLVAQEGRNYLPARRLPFGVQRGQVGFCFFNAAHQLLRAGALDLVYVEGYALANFGVPLHHAWLARPGGAEAFDVTWPARQTGLAYRGVEVPLGVLHAHWRTCGGASVLDDFYHRWPALRVPYADWVPQLVRLLTGLLLTHCAAEVARGRAVQRADGSIFHREHLPVEERG